MAEHVELTVVKCPWPPCDWVNGTVNVVKRTWKVLHLSPFTIKSPCYSPCVVVSTETLSGPADFITT